MHKRHLIFALCLLGYSGSAALLPATAHAQTGDKALAPGDPPLTEKLVWEYAQAMGTFLEASLQPADLDFFRKLLKGDWKEKSSREGAMKYVLIKRKIDSLDGSQREEALKLVRPQLLNLFEQLAKKPDGDDARYLLAMRTRGAATPATAPKEAPAKATSGASGDLLDRVFTPRKEDDADLDTEGLLEKDIASVFPKLVKTGDALTDFGNLINSNQSRLVEGDLRRMVRYFGNATTVRKAMPTCMR